MKRYLLPFVAFVALAACLLPALADAQQALVVKPLVEKKVATLPPGDLFWRIENFPALDAGTIRRRRVGARHRVGGQGLAVHARCQGRRVARRRQGRRGRADSARRRR